MYTKKTICILAVSPLICSSSSVNFIQAFCVLESHECRKFTGYSCVRDVKREQHQQTLLDCPIRSQRTCSVDECHAATRQRQNAAKININTKRHYTRRQWPLWIINSLIMNWKLRSSNSLKASNILRLRMLFVWTGRNINLNNLAYCMYLITDK